MTTSCCPDSSSSPSSLLSSLSSSEAVVSDSGNTDSADATAPSERPPVVVSKSQKSQKSTSPFRPDCLAGKRALVTGGGSGLGLEIARQFVRHGCAAVYLCGRCRHVLQQAVTELLRLESTPTISTRTTCAVYAYALDVRDPAQCEAVMDFVRRTTTTTGEEEEGNDGGGGSGSGNESGRGEYDVRGEKSKGAGDRPCQSGQSGMLDILVNGAAGNFLATAEELSPRGFATIMNIDALGTFHMCRAAFPLLVQSKRDAVIINISATLHYGATYWQAPASAAKSAVDSLTRSLALEWGSVSENGKNGIRVVGIAPGPIADTPGTAKLLPLLLPPPPIHPNKQATTADEKITPTTTTMQQYIEERIPLRRMGRPYEIGYAAVYLCTALFVTGTVLVVDGGEWLAKPPPSPSLIPRAHVARISRHVEAQSRNSSSTQQQQQQQKQRAVRPSTNHVHVKNSSPPPPPPYISSSLPPLPPLPPPHSSSSSSSLPPHLRLQSNL